MKFQLSPALELFKVISDLLSRSAENFLPQKDTLQVDLGIDLHDKSVVVFTISGSGTAHGIVELHMDPSALISHQDDFEPLKGKLVFVTLTRVEGGWDEDQYAFPFEIEAAQLTQQRHLLAGRRMAVLIEEFFAQDKIPTELVV